MSRKVGSQCHVPLAAEYLIHLGGLVQLSALSKIHSSAGSATVCCQPPAASSSCTETVSRKAKSLEGKNALSLLRYGDFPLSWRKHTFITFICLSTSATRMLPRAFDLMGMTSVTSAAFFSVFSSSALGSAHAANSLRVRLCVFIVGHLPSRMYSY